MKYAGPKQRQKNLGIFCQNNQTKGGYLKVTYLHEIDGDTAYFKVSGVNESVRFYIINTPETKTDEPYAYEAKNYTKQILENAHEIYLQSDVNNLLRDETESHRLLAWVWVDGKLLNYLLVREGYATVKYVHSEKCLYLPLLRKAYEQAKKEKLRIHKTM